MAGLELSNIRKSFGAVEVIQGVDLSVNAGEFVVFVGPSGCGKSTLLRMIAGLETITAGDIFIDAQRVNNVEPRDRGVAMVFQSYALYPHMTVYDNVGFSLKLAKAPKAERDRKIREAARILKMEELLHRKPGQLSGGQRQRVAIGRAIVRQPKVFLFDEPLSNLDAALRVDMRMELARLHKELGTTMIYVTHDQVEAMTLADKIVVLDRGVVMQIGSPIDLYNNPANRFVAGFIGSPRMNFLDVRVMAASNGSVTVESADIASPVAIAVDAPFKVGDALALGVRPHVVSQRGAVTAKGTVTLVERLGNESIVSTSLSSGKPMIAALPGDVSLDLGSTVTLGFSPADALLFDQTGARLR
jgi:multiple sugar transport system ATP-binding protein